MNPDVTGEFGVETRRQQAPLAHRDHSPCCRSELRAVRDARENLDPLACLLHPRCPDEHCMHGFNSHNGKVQIGLE